MKHRKQTPIVAPLTLLLGALLLTPFASRAADGKPPEVMSYQSFLVDAANQPLGNDSPANYTVEFRIYDVSESGTPIWGESQVVTVDKGYFNVLLGQGTALSGVSHAALSTLFSANNASDRYIGLTVSGVGSGELAPRLRLVGSPYAFLATHANSLATSAGASFLTYELDNSLSFKANTSGGSQLTLLPNGNLGVGRTAPTVALDVQGSARIINPTASASLELYSFRNAGNQNKINAYGARGTEASPQASHAGDYLLELLAFGNAGGDGVYRNAARIVLGAEAATTTTSSPGYVVFHTTASGDTSLAERMRITAAGNVGIGTATPDVRLHVSGGNIRVDGNGVPMAVNSGDANQYKIDFEDGKVRRGLIGASAANAFMVGNSEAKIRFVVSQAGRVGLNTSSPAFPLDVQGGADFPYSSVTDRGFTVDHDELTDLGGPEKVSINSEHYVKASGFTAVSDRRIKDNVRGSNGRLDLKAIEALRVTDYGMVDKVQNGNARRKGLIAQEVEEIIPGAVTKSAGFLPDVYSLAEESVYDKATGRLDVRLDKTHELKKGDKVRLFVGRDAHDQEVVEVKGKNSFVVNVPEGEWSKVFVYGREVDDFRSVDYDRVFVTAVSALQQLKKEKDAEVDSLRKTNSALERKLAAQEKRLAELERKAEERELKFIQFERLLRKRSGVQQASLRD